MIPAVATVAGHPARRRLAVLGLVLGVLGHNPAAQQGAQAAPDQGRAPPDALEFGLLPFASAGTLFKRFAPLREYLAQRLGMPVRLRTAPDFPSFVRRTQAGRYHIALSAPHFTLLAIDSGRYQVHATYRHRLSAVVVARKGGPEPGDQRCRRVATPPPSAVITLLGRDFLAKHVPGADYTYRAYATHNAAVKAVVGGDACLAVVSVNVWNRVRAEDRGLVRVARTPTIPALGILLRNDLPERLKQGITEALVTMRRHPAGRRALKRMAYPGYRRADASTFETARQFLELLPKGWPGPGQSQ